MDLKGKTFDRWLVLEQDLLKSRETKATCWKCRCCCGVEKSVSGSNLRLGKTKGCGCLNGVHSRKRPYEALYGRLTYAAKEANRSCDIAYEDFLEFTKVDECHYCRGFVGWSKFSIFRHKNGVKYGNGIHGSGYHLDRKDNSKGYLKDNVVVCCVRCNRGKLNNFTYEEWYAMTAIYR